MEILRTSEEIIYPAASAHPTLHRLSEPDQPYRHDMGILYFYKQGPASSEALKRSLSKTLAIFYPLAGRLVERSTESVATCPGKEGTCGVAVAAQEGEGTCPELHGRGGDCKGTCPDTISGTEERRGGAIEGRADVSCLDQGALFCEAWTDTRLDAYQPDFQPHPDFNLLRLWGHDHTFLVQIKVTYFSCGGICLCVQVHHALVDGIASSHFMKCWIEIANGAEGPSVCPYINHPQLESMYLPKDVHNSPKEDHSPYLQPFPSMPTEEIPNKILLFKPEFIEALKREASHEGRKYSSFDCIVAYMSKIVTLARGTPSNEEVCISYPVNGRGILEPPLPPSYFGNAVFQTHESVKVQDIVEKPLSHIARHVREATSKITDGYIRSVLDESKRQPAPMLSLKCLSKHIYFNSWTSFPLSDLNFGWGSPLCCRVRLIPGELVLLFPSSLGKGHIEVLVALHKEHMENLDSLLCINF